MAIPSLGPGGRPRLPLDGSDLLLILILNLAAARVIGVFAAGLSAGPAPRLDTAGAVILVLGLHSLCVVGAVHLVAVRGRGVAWSDLGLRPPPRRWYARALLLAVASFVLVSAVNALVGILLGEMPDNPQFEMVGPAGRTPQGAFGMLVMVGAIVPFVEELLFRAILYAWLRRRWGVAASALASGLCFAVLHGIAWLIPAITLLGALLAVIYERSGSLWPAVITHGIFNSITIILLYSVMSSGLAP